MAALGGAIGAFMAMSSVRLLKSQSISQSDGHMRLGWPSQGRAITIAPQGVTSREQSGRCLRVKRRSAAQLLAKSNGQGLDWRFVRHVAVGVAHALQFAFEQDIVHRNVTPSNILMNESGSIVKLGDLYLAKALIGANAFDVTRTDDVIGHLPYLSPEQIEHLPGQNHLSDLYSLGATLYALLTGGPAFVSDSPTELLRQITTRAPNPLRATHPEIPAHFESVVLRLLAKRPEDRLPNPAELLKQLRSDRTD